MEWVYLVRSKKAVALLGWRLFYTQPCSQISESLRLRHGITSLLPSKTASNSTNSITSSGNSGRIILLTKKCFRFCIGFTAVHLLRSSFLGWRGFCSLEGIALKFICTTNHFSWARGKAVIRFLYLCGTFHIKITLRAKTSTVIVLTILKL